MSKDPRVYNIILQLSEEEYIKLRELALLKGKSVSSTAKILLEENLKTLTFKSKELEATVESDLLREHPRVVW